AQVQGGIRRRVRVEARDRAGEELEEVRGSTTDRAADGRGIVTFDVGRGARVACQDQVAKTRGEALDLRLDAPGHVDGRRVRNVAVRVARVPAHGRAQRVEQALLRDEHEGSLGDLAAPGRALRRGDLLQLPPDVHRGDTLATARAPGDGTGEGPVELVDRRTVAVPLEPAAVPRRQAITREFEQLSGREVQ